MSGTNPQTLQDYFFPRTGQTDKDGRDVRLALPTYLKDVVGEAHALRTSVMERSPEPIATDFSHKLNPYVAITGDMWNNKDYYGVEIRHPDDPIGKQPALPLFRPPCTAPRCRRPAWPIAHSESPAGANLPREIERQIQPRFQDLVEPGGQGFRLFKLDGNSCLVSAETVGWREMPYSFRFQFRGKSYVRRLETNDAAKAQKRARLKATEIKR